MNYSKITILFALILIIGNVFAISAQQASDIVSNQNNFILDGEQPRIYPLLPINYENEKYWVVGANSDGTVNCYIPIKDSTSEVAQGDIELRELIKTAIVLENINTTISTAQYNWPFSIPNKSYFYDLATSFENMKTNVSLVENSLSGLNDANATNAVEATKKVKDKISAISIEFNDVAKLIDEGILLETNYLNEPKTNNTQDYENKFEELFSAVGELKTNYNELTSALNSLKTQIGQLPDATLSLDGKKSLNNNLNLPTNVSRLKTLFDETSAYNNTLSQLFSKANSSITINSFIDNLKTRIERNEAWKVIYKTDEEFIKIDSRITSLQKAAESILAEDNVNAWVEQAQIEPLRQNWQKAESYYNTSRYAEAKNAALSARKNAVAILKGGQLQNPDDSSTSELLVQIVVALIAIVIGLFLLDKFVLNKNKKKEEEDGYEDVQ